MPILPILVSAAFCVNADGPADRATVEDNKLLVGTWFDLEIKSAPGAPADILTDVVLEFTDGKGVWTQISKKPGTAIGVKVQFSYRVDATKVPKQMDMVLEIPERGKKTALAIYSLEGDSLRITFGKDERPKQHPSKPVQGTWDLHLKRKTPGSAGP